MNPFFFKMPQSSCFNNKIISSEILLDFLKVGPKSNNIKGQKEEEEKEGGGKEGREEEEEKEDDNQSEEG